MKFCTIIYYYIKNYKSFSVKNSEISYARKIRLADKKHFLSVCIGYVGYDNGLSVYIGYVRYDNGRFPVDF